MIVYLLFKIALYLTRILPMATICFIATNIVKVKYYFSGYDKACVKKNLQVIFNGSLTENELDRKAKSVFVNFTKSVVEFFYFKKLNKKFFENKVDVINEDYLKDAIKKKKGVIILSAHIGNWEMAAACLSYLGYHVHAIALDHSDSRINQFFIDQRQSQKVETISMKRGLKKCFHVLDHQGNLAIVADRDFTNNGAEILFFNKRAYFPKGPALFKIKSGCVIVPLFLIRKKGKYVLHIEKEIDSPLCGDNSYDVVAIMRACSRAIEKIIRMYPEQWCVFRTIWERM